MSVFLMILWFILGWVGGLILLSMVTSFLDWLGE